MTLNPRTLTLGDFHAHNICHLIFFIVMLQQDMISSRVFKIETNKHF